jgi:hypothetical protein
MRAGMSRCSSRVAVMRFPRVELMRDPRYVADAIRTALGRG